MFGKSPNVSAKTSAFIRGKRLKCDENAVFSSKTMYKKTVLRNCVTLTSHSASKTIFDF